MNRSPQPAARDQLIQDHLGFVRSIAIRVKRSLSAQLDLDELVSYGHHGLVEAADRFDPSRGIAFTTFSYYRIRGAIFDGLRQQGWLSRRQWARFAEGCNAYLSNVVERDASSPGTTPDRAAEQVASAVNDLATIFLTTLDVGGVREPPDETSPDSAEALERQEEASQVRAALASLPDKERRLLDLCYFSDLSLAAAGRELGLSKSWSSRLHARAIRLLSEELEHLAPP